MVQNENPPLAARAPLEIGASLNPLERTKRGVTTTWISPNAISLFRVAAGPICLALLISNSTVAIWAALGFAIAAELSDFLDGHVARSTGQASPAGKVLDPMADSLYRSSLFLAFLANGWMPLWMLVVMIGRDIIVSRFREIAESGGRTLAARPSGKWKAVAQGVSQIVIIALVAAFGVPAPTWFGAVAFALLLGATIVTAYSLVDYALSVLGSET